MGVLVTLVKQSEHESNREATQPTTTNVPVLNGLDTDGVMV